MLILTRKIGQAIVIDGRIVVRVIRNDPGRVTLGIEAPDEVLVWRQELLVLEALKPVGQETKTCAACGKVIKNGRFLGTLHLCS